MGPLEDLLTGEELLTEPVSAPRAASRVQPISMPAAIGRLSRVEEQLSFTQQVFLPAFRRVTPRLLLGAERQADQHRGRRHRDEQNSIVCPRPARLRCLSDEGAWNHRSVTDPNASERLA